MQPLKSGNVNNFWTFTGHVITYPCWDSSYSSPVKGNPAVWCIWLWATCLLKTDYLSVINLSERGVQLKSIAVKCTMKPSLFGKQLKLSTATNHVPKCALSAEWHNGCPNVDTLVWCLTICICVFLQRKCVVLLKWHRYCFPSFKLKARQHWFRLWLGAQHATGHCLNQRCPIYRRTYACFGFSELNNICIRL